jgi:hypothetical protein
LTNAALNNLKLDGGACVNEQKVKGKKDKGLKEEKSE